MLCCGFQELRLAGNVQCPHNTTDRGAQTGYRLGHLKMLQTEPHQNKVQTVKTHACQSQTEFLMGDYLE